MIININIVTNKTMCKILHHGILSSEFTGTFLISLHAIIESPTILFKYIPVSKKNVPGFQIKYFLHVRYFFNFLHSHRHFIPFLV